MGSYFKMAGVFLLFSLCILFPEQTVAGSKNGLLLWYDKLLPVLFPGMLFGGLMKRTGVSKWLIEKSYPVASCLFPCSDTALFVIFTGFFCGYPMAAIQAEKAWQRGELSEGEFHYCMSFANLPGPVFLTGFVLGNSEEKWKWLLVFYGCILIVSQIARICFLSGNKTKDIVRNDKEKTSFFLAFQEEIYQAASSLIQIAGILMVCSMLISYSDSIFEEAFLLFLSGMLEMSSGIGRLLLTNMRNYELFALFAAGFGGLSVMLQIFTVAQSSIKNTRYSLWEYLVFKALFLLLFLVGAKLIILR